MVVMSRWNWIVRLGFARWVVESRSSDPQFTTLGCSMDRFYVRRSSADADHAGRAGPPGWLDRHEVRPLGRRYDPWAVAREA